MINYNNHKAQNFVEVALLAVVVLLAAFYVLGLFNNQKVKLANLSSVHVNSVKSVNLNNMTEGTANKQIASNKSSVETAGALSLKLLGMSEDDYQSAMSNITYSELKAALSDTSGGENIATLANSLIKQYGLSDTKISADNISSGTLDTLTDVLDNVSSKNDTSTTAQAFTQRLQSLLKAASSS